MGWIRGLISWFVIVEFFNRSSASFVNKPKLSSCASWKSTGITIVNSTAIGFDYYAFIDINDTLYVSDPAKRTIEVLPERNGLQRKTINFNFTAPLILFVTRTGDIYFDDLENRHVNKWSVDTLLDKVIVYMKTRCIGIFVTIDYVLYCSIYEGHQVINMSLNSNVSLLTTAAGTGCPGSTSAMLNRPIGIYVDIDFDLYVADSGNDRIQLFPYGESNGITAVGEKAVISFTLNQPTSVTIDADGSLYIVDSGSERIIRSGLGGSECIIGCSIQPCVQSDQLCGPLTAIFDSLGNLYVSNYEENGIQKYTLATNSCNETSTSLMQTSATSEKPQTNGQNVPSTIRTTTPVISQTCFPPNITLFPGPSYLLTQPLQFRRSQDFYITAILKLACAESLEIETKWSIYNCTLNCSTQANIDPSINTSFSELYIPTRTLIYGLYEFKLTVTMRAVPSIFATVSAFAKINPSGITANLVQFGTSMVTSGQDQELILNPGVYSINLDESIFNASDWTYQYRCRLYDSTNITTWIPIDLPNYSCFSNRADPLASWEYNLVNASRSAVKILNGSLRYNHTYQFEVYMINRRNLTAQATGYLIVKVDNTRPQMVAVACVISTMCSPNLDYQYINPSTQVALFSDCVGKCFSVSKIYWNIYQGFNSSSTGVVEWTRFTQNLHFFGMNTSNFTALNTIFRDNEEIIYWRFEVVYTFPNEISASALNFMINQPPSNGSCSIYPRNGTTSTLFTINCTDWLDADNVKDYSFYLGRTPSEEVMLAYTVVPTLRIQLPAGNDNRTELILTVRIRDDLNCVAEFYMEPVVVVPDQVAFDGLIDMFQNSTVGSTNNSIIQDLASGNQNIIGQIVTSLSQELNKRNKHNLETAITNGTPAASVSVSPLGSKIPVEPFAPTNGSISSEYKQQLTNLANVRHYLMKVTTDLAITTNIDSIKLQANTLAQLTKATNELTRSASMLASTKCHQLAVKLKEISMRISYEDARFASNQIAHCVNHVLTAINAPLQHRGVLLNISSVDEDIDDVDYDADFELFQLTLNRINDENSESIKNDRILYYQRKTANQIAEQSTATLSLITAVLNVHLNIGQNLTMNSTSLLISLETITIESLSNKSIQQVGNAHIHIPIDFQSNLTKNASVSLRSTMQPLASIGAFQSQANTNMSTMISLTVLDQEGNEIPIHASDSQPIEFRILRDPNLILPEMILQNVISKSSEESSHLDLDQFVTNNNLTVSLHFELRPSNIALGYLFIYQFDRKPQLNSVKYDIDDWVLLCPCDLSNKTIYTYYINNRRTAGRRFVIYQLRELNPTEVDRFCQKQLRTSPPIFDEPVNFTSNYELRVYSSGCYYLDKYNNWQSDGLWVGKLTDHYQTQCFSTHLTTFASSYLVLSFPTDENNVQYQLKDLCDLRKNLTRTQGIDKYEFLVPQNIFLSQSMKDKCSYSGAPLDLSQLSHL